MRNVFLFAILVALLPASAQAIKMGGPGFPMDKNDLTVASEIGYRSYDFHSNGRYDTVNSFEFGGRIAFAPLSWWQPQLLFGGATASRSSDQFEGNLAPQIGLLSRFILLNKETATSGRVGISLDVGGQWQMLSGTRPGTGTTRITASGHLWEGVSGLTFSFCTDRTCAYGGGRYSFFALREGVSLNKHLGGVYGGIDYFVTPVVFFNIEAQNFDADAIYAGVGARF